MDRKKFLLDIEKLLDSKAKINILKALYNYRNIEQSISFIAREAGISSNQAKLIIDDYKEMNIITYRVSGKSSLVRLKEGNVYFDILSNIFKKQENIVFELKEEIVVFLKTQEIDADVWIYGSFARNELENGSDIDMLFLFKNKKDLENKKEVLLELSSKMSDKYLKVFSFLMLTSSEFDKDYKGLKKNILVEGEKI
ncbi:hypothetical protein C0585_07660 [Candidatus Woesearchaeota archaeon]|nr:MAG: hypothetical protein C0585_07660 [Candidatus Woesearchaeota archaeon]